jgi:hypothetical protein
VSFGDLLTLLLCFFVAIVAYHTKGDPNQSEKNRVTSENNTIKIDPGAMYQKRELSGTPLANLTESSESLVLRFEPADYNGLQEQMTDEAKRWFQKAIQSDDYNLSVVRLEVCGNTPPGQGSSGWLVSMRRALDIRRQLVDAGFSTEGFELELLGADCSKLESKGGKKTVAALTLRTERIFNG